MTARLTTLALLTALTLACGSPAKPTPRPGPAKARPRPAKEPDKPAPAAALALEVRKAALLGLPQLPTEGLVRLQLAYTAGKDRMALYLDAQLSKGQPTTLAVADALPLPRAKLAPWGTADRFAGKPWKIRGEQAGHARWGVKPLDDLEPLWGVWGLVAGARGLGAPTAESGDARAGTFTLSYPWATLRLGGKPTRVQQIVARGVDGKPAGAPVVCQWSKAGLVLARGTSRLHFARAGGKLELEKVTLSAAGPKGATAEVRLIADGAPDPMRAAYAAYDAAVRAEKGVGAAVRALQARFGDWVSRSFTDSLRGQAWVHIEKGDLPRALATLAAPHAGVEAAGLDPLAAQAERAGHPLEALALSHASAAATATPPRLYQAAVLALGVARRPKASPSRALLEKYALERLARVAATPGTLGASALALARLLHERPKVASAVLVGQIELPAGADNLAYPVSAEDAVEQAKAGFDRYVGRVTRDLKTHRADLGPALERLITAINADSAVPISRLLLTGDVPPEVLQTHLSSLLAWVLPAKATGDEARLVATIGTVLGLAYPRAALDAAQARRLSTQLSRTGPEVFEKLLAHWLPTLSPAAREKARKAFAARLVVRSKNPLYPLLKWPVPGLVTRLDVAARGGRDTITTAEAAMGVVLRAWGRLEAGASPVLLARDPARDQALQAFIRLAVR